METETISGAVHPLPGLAASQLLSVAIVTGSQFGELSITLMVFANGAALPAFQEKESVEGDVSRV